MQHRFTVLAGFLSLTGLVPAQPRRPLPLAVDLAPEFQKLGLGAEAQGNRDVCSLFAVTALADFESARHGGPVPRRSAEFLIWAARKSTGHKGEQAMFYEAVHGLNTLGICAEALMPYSARPNLNVQPGKKQLANAQELAQRWRVHWIRRWDGTRPLTDAELHALKAALAAGHPVACGLRWPKQLTGFAILAVPRPADVFDGHSIAFVGFEDDPRINGGGAFRFRNSSGAGWGENGYGRMSYAYVRAYANDALWLELGRPGSEVPLLRFEAEKVRVAAKRGCDVSAQDMSNWGRPMWSQGRQLFCAAKDGGFVELALEIPRGGRYRLRVLATAAPDFGKVRVLLDGKRQGPTFDLYCGRVSPSGSLELGTHELTAGRHTLGFHAVGKNSASSNYFFGIDAVDLLRAN